MPPVRRPRVLAWLVLAGLLAGVTALAVTFDRGRWPGLVGDEATYLMAAQSLAFDGDFSFSAGDLERFRAGRSQQGIVILQSGDGGRRLAYGKPFFYPLFLAPFVRLAGDRGAVVANALWLLLTAGLAALAIGPSDSGAGPSRVAILLFCSVAFAHVFWIQSDLFLMGCGASALALAALALVRVEKAPRWCPRGAIAGVLVGLLSAVVVVSRPAYLALLAVPLWQAWRARKPRFLAGLAAGVVAVALAAALFQGHAAGVWSPYGGERRGFSELTGFPGVDFPRESWADVLSERGNASWFREGILEPAADSRLVAWNAWYFLVGQKVGLLPYFLPAVLGIAVLRRSSDEWVAFAAAVVSVLVFLVISPFNFYGGAGSLANRYFLPIYPLLWFAGAPRRETAWKAGIVVVSALTMWPLWAHPRQFPAERGERWTWVSSLARRWLPIETTQRHLGPPQQGDIYHRGFWMRPLDGALRPEGEPAVALEVDTGRSARVLVATAWRLHGVRVDLLGPGDLVPQDGEAARDADGRWVLSPGRALAHHPMWWTPEAVWIYRLKLRFEGPADTVRVRLDPVFGGG